MESLSAPPGGLHPRRPADSKSACADEPRGTGPHRGRRGVLHVAQRINCPLLVVFGAGDKLISVSEGERLARAASGPTELVVFEEGNHVCFNISYKFRPLTADWTAEHLNTIAH